MDLPSQVSGLDSESREALAHKIKHLLLADSAPPDHDVTIIGGGVAGLTLALEIRGARPQSRILVVSPTSHPVPEITHTVGESTVEVSAH